MKFVYSERSKDKLATCHPDLQKLFSYMLKYRDHTILCGRRDKATQNKAFENKSSKLKWPHSMHNRNPSYAVDVAPYPIDWEDENAFVYFAGKVMMLANIMYDNGTITHHIRYGGDWDNDKKLNDQTLYDFVHFELLAE